MKIRPKSRVWGKCKNCRTWQLHYVMDDRTYVRGHICMHVDPNELNWANVSEADKARRRLMEWDNLCKDKGCHKRPENKYVL